MVAYRGRCGGSRFRSLASRISATVALLTRFMDRRHALTAASGPGQNVTDLAALRHGRNVRKLEWRRAPRGAFVPDRPFNVRWRTPALALSHLLPGWGQGQGNPLCGATAHGDDRANIAARLRIPFTWRDVGRSRARSRWPRTIRIRQDASVTTAKPPVAISRNQVIDRVAD
jgi:hypothetical protein